LAKLWSRKEFDLSKEFPQLDDDDIEDFQDALKRLITGKCANL
jgi:hypothetical protein